jgi:iron complex transport system substrate-binding protein
MEPDKMQNLRKRAYAILQIFSFYVLSMMIGGAVVPAGAETVTVEDCLGREVAVKLPARRIVALNSDVVEILRTIKAQTLLVGVFSQIEREREFWGDLASLPKVGSWRDADLEAIAGLSPDLVVCYGSNPGRVFEDKAAALGIQVLRLDFYQIDTMEREVRLLGQLLNRTKEAENFCAWHRRYLKMISGRLEQAPLRPTVYVESYTDYNAAGPASGGHRMCEFSGGRNIAADLAIPYPCVTPEWVVSQDPEVIIKAASYGNGYAQTGSDEFNLRRDAIMARPAWHHISAQKNGRVHVMDSAIWTGPRAVIGMAYMARWLHPDLFRDLDPEVLHREYLELFQGIPYKGVYVSATPNER